MKKQKINYWKIATIIFAVTIAIILLYDVIDYQNQQKIISFGNFQIDQYHLNQFSNVMKTGQDMKVCNLNQGGCFVFTKIG